MTEGLPQEVEEWLRSVDAHKEAAERIGAFYNGLITSRVPSEGAIQLTQAWLMVCYGWPKGMPMPGGDVAE